MNKDKKRGIIIWIDSKNMTSGTTNNFIYSIGNICNNVLDTINVELLKAYIPYNTQIVGGYNENIIYNASLIKIYIDFFVGSNCIYNGNGVLLGVINPEYLTLTYLSTNALEYYEPPKKYGEELIGNSIKYILYDKPNNQISIKICDENDNILTDNNNASPERVLLCIKLSW